MSPRPLWIIDVINLTVKTRATATSQTPFQIAAPLAVSRSPFAVAGNISFYRHFFIFFHLLGFFLFGCCHVVALLHKSQLVQPPTQRLFSSPRKEKKRKEVSDARVSLVRRARPRVPATCHRSASGYYGPIDWGIDCRSRSGVTNRRLASVGFFLLDAASNSD